MNIDKLKEVKKVRFNDYSEYDSEYGNNGGKYGYWTEYRKLHNGLIEISYGTTADFDFCPVCGCFNNHYDYDSCYESGYSCGDYETVSESELLKLINDFETEETEECFIELL